LIHPFHITVHFLGREVVYSAKGEEIMEDKKKIGWFCSYVPEELIIASGLEPVRLKGQVKELRRVDSYVFSNICPYLKNILDSGLRNRLEHLNGIIFTNSCDGMRKLYDLWTQYVQTPFTFMLEVPKNRDKYGIRYFSDQLHALQKGLEKAYDVDISPKLQSAISLMNNRRVMLGRIFEGQKEFPPRLKGSELFSLCQEEMSSPKDDTTLKLEDLAFKPRPSDSSNADNARILVMGNTLDNPTLFDLVENAKGSVIIFDTCKGLKHYSDLVEAGPDKIESLARRYLLKPPCPRMPGFDLRIERLKELIQNYSIGGIIYSNLKYCDYSLFEIPQIEQFSKENQVPLLVLENDYLLTDVERLKIRVEAFLEMVRGDVL